MNVNFTRGPTQGIEPQKFEIVKYIRAKKRHRDRHVTRKKLNDILVVLVIFVLTLIMHGCASVIALQQPKKLNISLFTVGTARSSLKAEFGEPTESFEKEGKEYEIFLFRQGYSSSRKIGKAIFHVIADVFTLFTWELYAIPNEKAFSSRQIAYQVGYDVNDKVDIVILLKE